MTLNEIADELIEARRYVRSDIEHTREKVAKLIQALRCDGEEQCLGLNHTIRLQLNVGFRLEYIQVDPALLENALYNAAAELRIAALRLEPKEEPL